MTLLADANDAGAPVFAARLRGRVTADRKLILDIPEEVTPGAVEVILLYSPPSPVTRRRAKRAEGHPAFGIWADRADLTDAADFAAALRRKIEDREDSRD